MARSRSQNRKRSSDAQPVPRGGRARPRRLLRLVGVLLLLAGVAVGGVYGFRVARTSPAFALRKVIFTGQKRTTQAELMRLSGLALGQNLLGLELPAIERAMEEHPWLKQVKVSRRPPNVLLIHVTEHLPEAMATLGELYLVDEEGEPFRRVQPDDGLDLLLISGIDRPTYEVNPSEAQSRFRRALEAAHAYERQRRQADPPLSEVRLESDELVLVLSGSGQEIRLGGGDFAPKLDRLGKVQDELSRRGLIPTVIHLDNRVRPGWVTVKLGTPAVAQASTDRQQ